MKLYDTLSGEKKKLRQTTRFGFIKQPLSLFVCGPTVYDYPHIGNARTFVFFDMFTRYLRSQGVAVRYLQNITDVDDKILQKAEEEGVSWQVVSKKYEDIYFENLKQLGIDTAQMQFARATEYIPQIVAQVKRLRETGHAYEIKNDGWYFDLTTYADYGQLAKRTISQAEDGVTRVDNSENKRNAGDFCLWKFTKHEHEPSWESELGAGRPGWHIEDTAITESFFGPQYDIHGGAIDLKFPHHEAERAQQESASGKKPFVRYWMHAGFLTVNGQKMSKSLGNFMTIDDVLKKITADEFRMMLLMHHYRQPLDFAEQTMSMAQDALHYFRVRVQSKQSVAVDKNIERDFTEAMADDFNTPRAIAALRQSNDPVFIEKALSSFGITAAPIIPEHVQKLLGQRELSRASKQFAQSDALRKEIEQLGYVIEDTKEGPLVLPK